MEAIKQADLQLTGMDLSQMWHCPRGTNKRQIIVVFTELRSVTFVCQVSAGCQDDTGGKFRFSLCNVPDIFQPTKAPNSSELISNILKRFSG